MSRESSAIGYMELIEKLHTLVGERVVVTVAGQTHPDGLPAPSTVFAPGELHVDGFADADRTDLDPDAWQFRVDEMEVTLHPSEFEHAFWIDGSGAGVWQASVVLQVVLAHPD